MKSLVKFLTESNINYYVYFHSDLSDGKPIISKNQLELDFIEENDLYDFLPLWSRDSGNIAIIWWNEEEFGGKIYNYKNEKDFQKSIKRVAKNWWEDYQKDDYIEFDDWFFGNLPGASSPDDIYSKLLETINESFALGEGNKCYLIVDLKAKKVIAGGENSEPTFNY